jgi:general secretion pathway protein E
MMKDIGMAGIKKDTYTLYRATGCEECAHTGYHGRVGIYEVLSFSDHMRKAVRDGASPGEIMSLARENDLVLMREDGILKAMK